MGEKRLARGAQLAATCALALAGLYAGNNPDTFGHLAQGRQIFDLGRVPQLDTWSLLPGAPRPWHNYEWLSDLLFYALYRGFGYDGLLGFKCFLLGATAFLLVDLARHWAGARAAVLAALWLIASIPAARFRFSDRPHILGLCLAAAVFGCLSWIADADGERSQRRRSGLSGALFVLHLLWVNLHGSHLLGLAMTALFTALGPRSQRNTFLRCLALQALASCISPYGPSIVLDAVEHVFDPRYRALVSEWNPWSEGDPPWLQIGPALQAALLTLVTPRIVRQGGSLRAATGIVALLAIASFRSIRFVAEFVLLSAPVAGAGYAQLLTHVSLRRFALGAASVFAALSAVVPWGAAQLPPSRGLGHGIAPHGLPFAAGSELARLGTKARVFAALGHNWPLMWMAPEARFVIDGRTPFYGPEYVRQTWFALHRPELFDQVARSADVTAVLIAHALPDEQALVRAMTHRAGWSLRFIDDEFALYTRDDISQGLRRFTLLQPTLAPFWVLSLPAAREAQLRSELQALENVPSAQGYRHWVKALHVLAPLQRGRAQDGFRWPSTQADWARYRSAASALAVAARKLPKVPIIPAFQALVAATLCQLDVAERALNSARQAGPEQRLTVLVAQEITLRKEGPGRIEAPLRAALARPEAQGDRWLEQLATGVDAKPACPPAVTE